MDSGASITVFPKNMFPEREPNDIRLKTASGEMINVYGEGVIYGKDASGDDEKAHWAGCRCTQDPNQCGKVA